MIWLLFALMTPVMWAFSNILDKFILTKRLRNPYTFNILTMIYDAIPIFLIILFVTVRSVGPWNILGMLSGLVVTLSLLFYNKAMVSEEASRVNSLDNIYPIFVVIMAFLFLGESLDFLKYVGITLIVTGAIIISYKRVKSRFILSPALPLIIAFGFLEAVYFVISKYVLGYFDYWSFYFWSLIGSFLGGALMLVPGGIRKDFYTDTKKAGAKTLFYTFATSLVFYVGDFSLVIALSLGSASLISAISSTQPFFVLLFVSTISKLRPKVIKESVDKRTITLKIIAIALMLVGGYFAIAV